MDIESYREYCLAKPFVTEEFPFDENVLVFKVLGKMFALTDVQQFESVNLKCDPDIAIELREQYVAVIPGYHMSKKHWNTVMMNQSIPDSLFKKWIDDSYDLVVAGLPKRDQKRVKEAQ